MRHVFVNGYGAPQDPVTDGNLTRYLGQVAFSCTSRNRPSVIHLYGGYTNRMDMSEARAMSTWFEHHGIPPNCTLRVHDITTTARDNLVEFARCVGREEPVIIFCEESRRPVMEFFARRLFFQAEVIGVPFDNASLRPAHVRKQRTVKLWLEVAAWYFPPVEYVRLALRARDVARARGK